MMLHAVLVGIDAYQDGSIPSLCYARADARALGDALSRVDGAERSVRLLLGEEATRRNVMTAIGEDLHRVVEPDDVVLVYFAGHGSPERRGPGDRRARYLVPYDAERSRVFATGIDLDRDVHAWLTRLTDARMVVLVIDACFSGAAGGRTFMGPLLSELPERAGYLDDAAPVSLRSLDLGRGRVILCAADDDQIAYEDRSLGRGLFTHHLLAALQRPREGATVDIGDLYKEVSAAVSAATSGAQEPVISLIRAVRPRLPRLA
jgi:uncharacterized caspase-like protein